MTGIPGTPKAPGLPPFEQVLQRYGADVWRFVAAQLGPAHADDVFQDTMLAALAAYPRVRQPESVKSWLLRIAARKAIDAARARAREPVPVPDVRSAVTAADGSGEQLDLIDQGRSHLLQFSPERAAAHPGDGRFGRPEHVGEPQRHRVAAGSAATSSPSRAW